MMDEVRTHLIQFPPQKLKLRVFRIVSVFI